MHDLACTLRPVANGALACSVGPGTPRFDRVDPRPRLTDSYDETIVISATVSLSATEKYVSRPLVGPFRVLDMQARAGLAVTTSLRVLVGFENSDNVDTDGAPPGDSMITCSFGDNAGFLNAYFLTTAFSTFPVNHLHYNGTGRIVAVVTNSAASAQDIFLIFRVRFMVQLAPCELYEHD